MTSLFKSSFSIAPFRNSHHDIVWFKRKSVFVNVMHDIPFINPDGTYNMVCEIPRYTRKKMEMNWESPLTYIHQDVLDNGNKRSYQWGDMLFNYGALPQTWENPTLKCSYTHKYGDDDPIDVIDIGDTQAQCGQIYNVRVLGVLGMIDQNEMDWKVIALNVCDSHAEHILDIDDVDTYKPGTLHAIKEWMRVYKCAEGKVENQFAFNEQYQNALFAKNIILSTHLHWNMKQQKNNQSKL